MYIIVFTERIMYIMKEFLNTVANFLPGFRSGIMWKRIVAGIYYVFAIIMLFSNFWLFLFLMTIPYFIFGIINLSKAKKNGRAVKPTPIIIVGVIMFISFILFPVTLPDNDSSKVNVDVSSVSDSIEKSDDSNVASDTPEPTDTPVPTDTPAPTPEPTPEVTQYKAGSYKIGTDMPAGEYKLFTTETIMGMSYYDVCKDSSGSFSSIICNDNYSNFTYITLEEGQYLNMRDAYAVPVEELSAYQPEDGLYITGMYKVGFDIPAGEYKIKIDENSLMGMAYIERAKNSKHSLISIISNDNISAEKYLTIKDGEYLTIKGGYIEVTE